MAFKVFKEKIEPNKIGKLDLQDKPKVKADYTNLEKIYKENIRSPHIKV